MKYRKGEIINVEVTAIEPYGAFVKVDDVYTGVIHISEINGYYISDIYKFFSVGDLVKAKIDSIDDEKKQIKFTMKNLYYNKTEINKNRLIETQLGFSDLKDNLPKWIAIAENSMKNVKK